MAKSYLIDSYQLNDQVSESTYSNWNMNKINKDIEQLIANCNESYPDDLVDDLINHINENVLDESHMDVFNRTDRRQCSYLAFLVSVHRCEFISRIQSFGIIDRQQQTFNPIPNSTEHRYGRIVFFVDNFFVPDEIRGERCHRKLPSTLEHKERLVQDLNSLWENIKPLEKLYDPFFKDDEYLEVKQKWAWDYIKRQEWVHPAISENEGDSYADLVKLAFDTQRRGLDSIEKNFKKMRNAWYQKKNKMSSSGQDKKSYGILMSPDVMTQLDEVKDFYNTSRSNLLEDLVKSAHKMMLKKKAERVDNLLFDESESV